MVPMLLLGASLAACGENSTSDETVSEGGGGEEGTDDAIPAAVAAVEELIDRPTEIPVTTPLEGTVPSDGTAAWLQCSLPDCEILGPPLEEALNAFGWSMETINAGLTPEEVLDAWALAVERAPDAVFATGFPRSIFDEQLSELAGSEVPIIEAFVADESEEGISAVISGSATSRAIGVAFADWVLSNEGSSANVLFIHSSAFATGEDVRAGFEERFQGLCADCPYEVIDIPANEFNSIPREVVAILQGSPDINYIVADEGSMLVGLPQAMQTAGFQDVPVIGQYPSETTVQYLADGSVVKALVMPSMTDSMWSMVDAMARTFTGQSVEENEAPSPLWIVTPETAGELELPYSLVPDYQAQYRDLWSAVIG